MKKFERVLILSPHTDDGELGCGGTINRLLLEGSEVYYAAFSTAETSVPGDLPKDILKTEVKHATRELGIRPENVFIYDFQVRHLAAHRQEVLEILVKLSRDLKPDLVLQPSLNDIHQDHHTVAQEGLRAFKRTTMLGYELIWNNVTFNTTAFVRLDHKNIEAKWNALRMYRSQGERQYMQHEFVVSLARTRGTQIGVDFAEAFEVVRLMLA